MKHRIVQFLMGLLFCIPAYGAESINNDSLNSLKPLQLDSGTPKSEQASSKAPSPQVSDRSDSTDMGPLGFYLALGLNLGGAFHEKPDVRNKFDSGFAIGPKLKMRFLQFDAFRFGLNLNFTHFAYETSKGTYAITVSSKMNRLSALATIEFFKKAFFVNAQAGPGFMIVSVDSTLIQNNEVEKSEYGGVDPGFVAGMEVGVELGRHVFHLRRELDAAFHTDWMRHGERDEVAIFFNVNLEIVSSFE